MSYYPMLKYAGSGGSVDLDGDAQVTDVASGKTFYSDSATKQTGTMNSYTGRSVNVGFDTTVTVEDGFHGDGDHYVGPDLVSTTMATATAADIVAPKIAWVNGQKITGSFDDSTKMDYSGANSPENTKFPATSFTLKNTSNTDLLRVNSSEIYSPGMRYWKKGVVDGTLVADSSHKIYFPKGSIFWMTTNAYNYTTGKVIGSKCYTITTNGGASSTTALAVPKLTAIAASGEPLKCTLGADTSGPSKYYDSDTLYAGYIIIGSCGTACRVEYEIMPLLTAIPGFNCDN